MAGDFFKALTKTLEDSREKKSKLEQLLLAAKAQEQAKLQYDPTTMAKMELFKRIGAQQPPMPMGGYNPQEIARGIPAEVGQAHEGRQMDALLQLAGVKQAGEVPTIIFNPNTGTYERTGQMIPRGAPVRNLPLSNETIQGQAQARAAGGVAGNPVKKAAAQNFKDLAAGIERVDALLTNDTGFKETLFATGVPFQPGAGQLADELANMSDILLRARSGAQINEKEYQRLRGLLPRGRDAISEFLGNPDRAKNKLVKFRASLKEILDTGTPSQLETSTDFADEAEAEAANLPSGTRITIGGRAAVVQ